MGHVRIDSAKLQRVLKDMADAASERAAKKLRMRIREEIMISGRIDTGEMMERIDVEKVPPRPRQGRYRVKPRTKQFIFQDQGTRGSHARPGSALRFKPKGSSVFIFRKKTGPIPAAHFLEKAKRKMTVHDWGR